MNGMGGEVWESDRNRRNTWWALACLMSLAPVAHAGLNPCDPGLPAAEAYGMVLSNSNPGCVRPIAHRASSMCIDCHSANPTWRRTTGVRGSHFIDHHDGNSVRTTVETSWEKTDIWAASSGLSRYASPAPPDPLAASLTGTAAELICESCHNLAHNVAGGRNLLETSTVMQDPNLLCEGCHGEQASGDGAHHAMTGDTVGGDGDDPGDHLLDINHLSHLRDPVLGGASYTALDGVSCLSCHSGPHDGYVPTSARILEPGRSSIPETLWGGEGGLVRGKEVNVIYYDGNPETGDSRGDIKQWGTGDIVPGLDRQVDVEAAHPTQRLVVNKDPLCDSCHTFND